MSIISLRLMIPIGGKVLQQTWQTARRLAQVLTFFAAIQLLPSISLAADAPTRPEWCKPGWACVRTEEMAQDAEYHLDLRERVAQYRSRASRFGLTIGFGLGVGGIVSEEYDVKWLPTGGVFILYGIRF